MRQPDVVLDTTGLIYPMPLLRALKALTGMEPGEVLEVISGNQQFDSDIAELARHLGHELLETATREGRRYHYVRKGLSP